MKLIVGLGNFEEKYFNTRHNVGYLVIDELVATFKNGGWIKKDNLKSLVKLSKRHNIVFSKPLTFMNNSGDSVKRLVAQYKVKLPNLWIIHDDLDIPLGSYKIQFGVGPKVHKGIDSIDENLKTDKYFRVRVGVDNRDPKSRVEGEKYVLQDFSSGEKEILEKVIRKIVNDLIVEIIHE